MVDPGAAARDDSSQTRPKQRAADELPVDVDTTGAVERNAGTDRLVERAAREDLKFAALEQESQAHIAPVEVDIWTDTRIPPRGVAARRLRRFSVELSKARSDLDVETASPQELLEELTSQMIRAATATDTAADEDTR